MNPVRGRLLSSERRHPPTPPPPVSSSYPFAGTSAFFVPIPGGTPVHAASQTILQNNHWLPTNQGYSWFRPAWRCAMHFADLSAIANSSVYVNWPTVCATSPKYSDIKFPPNFAADLNSLGTDHVAVLIDSITGDYWEGWRVTGPGYPNLAVSGGPPAGSCNSNRWNAGIFLEFLTAAFNTAASGGNGVVPTGSGVSGSDIMIGNGLTLPQDFDDLSSGSIIPHAIQISGFIQSNGNTYPKSVPPARTGDGKQAIGVPAGARIRLKPSFDFTSAIDNKFPLEPANSAYKKLCRTLQVYGCISVDSTGAEGSGAFHCCYGPAVRRWPGRSNFWYPWENPSSNYGWSYGAGLPISMMNPANWDIMDWNVFTGA